MKNSNDTIGNRTRDLLTCSAVPQPTAPPWSPNLLMYARFLMCTEKSVSAQEGPHLRGNRAVLTSETSFVTSRLPLLLFIPCIEDNHFATLNPKNPQYCCLDICNITLNGQCDINLLATDFLF